ncbi:MutS protein msh5 [Kluyveromyces marxianus]|nr:MutS protein msh5 [Kluyveromyces marxianus]
MYRAAKRPIFVDQSYSEPSTDSKKKNIQTSNETLLTAEGNSQQLAVENMGNSLREERFDWENDVILCLELSQTNLGIAVYDFERESLLVLSQDITVKNNDSQTSCSEINMILEGLINENRPTVLVCSSSIGGSLFEHLTYLSHTYDFRIQMQPRDKFKIQYFFQAWIAFQEANAIIEIQGFQILDHICSSDKLIELTSTALGCIIKTMEHHSFMNLADEGNENNNNCLPNFFRRVTKVEQLLLKDRVFLDQEALEALQIFRPIENMSSSGKNTKNNASCIFDLLNYTTSEVGKSLLKKWLVSPLCNKELIKQRQSTIQILLDDKNAIQFDDLKEALKEIPNVFRIINTLNKTVSKFNAWVQWYRFCEKALDIIKLCHIIYDDSIDCELLKKIKHYIDKAVLGQLLQKTEQLIDIEASILQKQIVIKDNINAQLDEARNTYSKLENILSVVANESNQLVSSLLSESEKAIFDKLNSEEMAINAIYVPQLGYLLSVDIRIQEMIKAKELSWDEVFREENFIYYKTDDNRAMDEHFGDIHAIISDIEIEILQEFQSVVLNSKCFLFQVGECFAELEVLVGFARASEIHNYVKPEIEEQEGIIDIKKGRHPLYESAVLTYIPNDMEMDGGPFNSDTWDESFHRVAVITGPNSSGKSVFLTQNGLIVYLTHIGCYVPADGARIGLVDKILTRIVTKETVSKTQSTFQIDANQMSKCLSLATVRSLVLIDEFGKGTDVIDGPSLFGAIIKRYSENKNSQKIFVNITNGFDMASYYQKYSPQELEKFHANQVIVKNFLTWDLEPTSQENTIEDKTLRRKLLRILNLEK